MILLMSDIIYKDTLIHDLNDHDLDNKDQVRDLTAEPLNTIEKLHMTHGDTPADENEWWDNKKHPGATHEDENE